VSGGLRYPRRDADAVSRAYEPSLGRDMEKPCRRDDQREFQRDFLSGLGRYRRPRCIFHCRSYSLKKGSLAASIFGAIDDRSPIMLRSLALTSAVPRALAANSPPIHTKLTSKDGTSVCMFSP
jgi:hypothetical protein